MESAIMQSLWSVIRSRFLSNLLRSRLRAKEVSPMLYVLLDDPHYSFTSALTSYNLISHPSRGLSLSISFTASIIAFF